VTKKNCARLAEIARARRTPSAAHLQRRAARRFSLGGAAWRFVRAPLIGFAAAMALCAQAQAEDVKAYGQAETETQSQEQERPIMLLLGGGVSWDNNFFRVPNDVARSEQIRTAYVGLSLDMVYAQQEFQAHIIQRFNRYQNFSYLDFDPLDYDAAWRWHLTPRVSGSVSYAHTQYLNDFADTRNFTQLNIRTSEVGAFTLDAQLSGGWHLLAAIPYNEQKNSQVFTDERSYRELGVTPGLQYVWPSGNSITFNQSFLNGDYLDWTLDPVNQLDTGYRQYVSELLARWQVTGKSRINARLGWAKRVNDNFADRDVSGLVGRFDYIWTPTAKLRLSAGAGRNLGDYETDCSSYRVADVVTLGSRWQTSAKTSLQASLNWGTLDYRGALASCSSPEQRDRTHGAQLGASWAPLRNATIGASISYQHRSSNYPGQNWDDTIGQVNAALRF
jgi:exopolysaccharide biosynthesis operon protein EpsL